MDKVERYRSILQEMLLHYARITSSQHIRADPVFDQQRDHFAIIYAGWNGDRRAYGNTFYAIIRDGKVYIEHDGLGYGISNELVTKGIPEEDIILAWIAEEAEVATI